MPPARLIAIPSYRSKHYRPISGSPKNNPIPTSEYRLIDTSICIDRKHIHSSGILRISHFMDDTMAGWNTVADCPLPDPDGDTGY